MRRQQKKQGQSLVEMALVLPILLVVMFGIIEFGWLVFAYSTLSQSVRNGAEVAAQLPPYEEWMDLAISPNRPEDYPGIDRDDCYNAVLQAMRSQLTIIGDGANNQTDIGSAVTISYPFGGDTRNLDDRGPIEISVAYPVNGITPLFALVGMEEGVTMRVTQRRSLENLGRDPTRPQGVACARDVAEWQELRRSSGEEEPTP
ncbi:MAG: pilus assembly protein [Candidatus Viridilinea halotolerans]|uniref:Pilus assembly protein n=1 Tax=Candidatus Viridilinea halotolerans TaxID=2491704 RepID=A0A426TR13_9CHLR|nr:MAG: pilus assembly protein [Candidatus Viridilinea halotolerans]